MTDTRVVILIQCRIKDFARSPNTMLGEHQDRDGHHAVYDGAINFGHIFQQKTPGLLNKKNTLHNFHCLDKNTPSCFDAFQSVDCLQ